MSERVSDIEKNKWREEKKKQITNEKIPIPSCGTWTFNAQHDACIVLSCWIVIKFIVLLLTVWCSAVRCARVQSTRWYYGCWTACVHAFSTHDRVCMRPVSVFFILHTTVVFASHKRISSELQLTTRVVLCSVNTNPTAHSPSTSLPFSSFSSLLFTLAHSFTPFQPEYGSLLLLFS